ncbi:MAG: hypothetical protein NTNFB02_19160 [Nitrospira sp.]
MCRGLASAAMLVFCLWTASGDAREFSAERVVKSGKNTVTAQVNAKDDRWRFEYSHPQRWGANVVIVRADQDRAWMILSKRRQYAEVPIAPEHRLNVGEAMPGEQSREFVGAQTLNGYPTELFEVTVGEEGGARQYYRWVTKQERFPIKTVSKQGDWSEEYRHLIFTEQSSFLFELPQRLDPVEPPPGKSGGEQGDEQKGA